ncbi:MAG: 50S ribosomal protein L25 [Ilumatobacteraceae bacterium]
MASTVLTAKTGRSTGSPAARRMRRDDVIPGVLYGHGMTPVSVAVGRRDLRVALSGAAGVNTVLDLTVDDTVYPAIVKELQRHPVRRNVTHVDFIQVNLDEAITVSVPLRLVGEAVAVQQGGGLVDPAVDSVEVVTTPRSIPDEFVVDITAMDMDSVIRLSDLPMPTGVEPTGDPDSPLVTVLTMRAELAEIEAADAEVAEEQAEETTEGEAAEGETADAAAGEGASEEGNAGGDASTEE